MRIALDFDDTFTRDPKLWSEFIISCWQRGHDIRIVTFRHQGDREIYNRDLYTALQEQNINLPVIFTGGQRKRNFCANMGYYPDVWIDDMPEFIVSDDTYVPGEYLARQQGYGSK